ncbi:16S rRNA (uracil(1498)-N(3))-methyltransferase, partial [Acinetobacter baumannii]
WPAGRRLYVAAERAAAPPIGEAAAAGPFALRVGPAGGVAPAELDAVRELAFSRPVALGARILRADTAAIAGLAILQALVGDWRGSP